MEKKNQKCLCDNPLCAKCLGVNCEDKDCKIHTHEAKVQWQKKWEAGSKNY